METYPSLPSDRTPTEKFIQRQAAREKRKATASASAMAGTSPRARDAAARKAVQAAQFAVASTRPSNTSTTAIAGLSTLTAHRYDGALAVAAQATGCRYKPGVALDGSRVYSVAVKTNGEKVAPPDALRFDVANASTLQGRDEDHTIVRGVTPVTPILTKN